jgi:hypothetical protein
MPPAKWIRHYLRSHRLRDPEHTRWTTASPKRKSFFFFCFPTGAVRVRSASAIHVAALKVSGAAVLLQDAVASLATAPQDKIRPGATFVFLCGSNAASTPVLEPREWKTGRRRDNPSLQQCARFPAQSVSAGELPGAGYARGSGFGWLHRSAMSCTSKILVPLYEFTYQTCRDRSRVNCTAHAGRGAPPQPAVASMRNHRVF